MKIVLKTLRRAAFAASLLFVAVQFIPDGRTNPPVNDARTLAAHARLTPEVETILARSCMDCHSNQTRWPWYSNVAPASWFVADHVRHGREHLNFSEWSGYDREEAEHLLTDICQTVKGGSMPLGSYTLLHHDARLSARDARALCEWSRAERERLGLEAKLDRRGLTPCAPPRQDQTDAQ